MFRLEATWLWQYGHDTIPDWDGKLLIVDTDAHNSLVETNALPGTVAAYGYTIVLQGWITMLYNDHEVYYTKDDLIIYTPGMVVSVINISDDYRGICLVADKDFAFESPTMRDAIRAAYLPAVELREPRLTLAEDDNLHLMELMGIIRRYLLSAGHPFRSECLRTTYGLFLLELNAIQERTIRDRRFPKRIEELFFDFLRLVPIHFADRHDVAFYASQLCITPRYLSQIVREVSGRTVADYINQMLLMEASYLLQQTSLPIVDIADRLHFSEAASFTRFFTRNKGMTPREFRRGE
jgi:AraC-like DNA-binding protein